jgi:hypothetical protein
MQAKQSHLTWIAAALGLPHGFLIAGFPALHIAGAATLQLIAFAALALVASRVRKWQRPIAWALLASGLAIFAVRLIAR